MRLVIYRRTSTVNGSKGDSLDAQEDACRKWAEANGHKVLNVHTDPAISGGKPIDERPGLAAALHLAGFVGRARVEGQVLGNYVSEGGGAPTPMGAAGLEPATSPV